MREIVLPTSRLPPYVSSLKKPAVISEGNGVTHTEATTTHIVPRIEEPATKKDSSRGLKGKRKHFAMEGANDHVDQFKD